MIDVGQSFPSEQGVRATSASPAPPDEMIQMFYLAVVTAVGRSRSLTNGFGVRCGQLGDKYEGPMRHSIRGRVG